MQVQLDGLKVRRWREERCWSQEHLAEVAGIGLRTVQRVENGDKASRESVMALAGAFDVDAMALVLDTKRDVEQAVDAERARGVAIFRLVFWIHLASYAFGLLLFAAISVVVGAPVMKWAAIWWGVGLAAHALAVVIASLVSRHLGGGRHAARTESSTRTR